MGPEAIPVFRPCICVVTVLAWTVIGPGFRSWHSHLLTYICYRINFLSRHIGYAVLEAIRAVYGIWQI